MYYSLNDFVKRGNRLKVFISWSGNKSREVAQLLYSWLPNVLQPIKPWVSIEDIETGSIWFNQICEQIKEVCNSIIVVTNENKEKPWIMFEAGALCKGDDKNRLNIFLVDINPEDLKQPLASFNTIKAEKESLWNMVKNLNNRLIEIEEKKDKEDDKIKLSDEQLRRIFEKWYPDFEKELNDILIKYPTNEIIKEKTRIEEMQEEILLSVRSIENALIDVSKQVQYTTGSSTLSSLLQILSLISSLPSYEDDKPQ